MPSDMTASHLHRAKSTSSVPRSSSFASLSHATPSSGQSQAIKAANVAFHRHSPAPQPVLERRESRNCITIHRANSQSRHEDLQGMTMAERADRGLRREKSLKRTLRGVEPGLDEDGSGKMVRKVKSMGGHFRQQITDQHNQGNNTLKTANSICNLSGKENKSSSTTPLPPYSSPGPPIARRQLHPLASHPVDFQTSVDGGYRHSQSAYEWKPRSKHAPSTVPGLRAATATPESKIATLRHRASFMLTPLTFRGKRSFPIEDGPISQRKWSAGTGTSAISGASRRSRAESLRDKLRRYFRKSSTGSVASVANETGIPDQHVEAKRNYYSNSNFERKPGSPTEGIGLGIETRVKSPASETIQSKSRVTSWADSSIAGTVENRNMSQLSMIVEDSIKPPATNNEKRGLSIGSSFMKKLMRRSVGQDSQPDDPVSVFGSQRRHASFVSLASWRHKSTVRSVTPDVGAVILEESTIDDALASGCQQPPNTPYSTKPSNLELVTDYRPTEEQLAIRQEKSQNKWQTPLDEHRSLFFPRSPSSPSKSRTGTSPVTPKSTPMRPVTTIVKLSPVVTNLERSFNSLREPESPGSPEKFGAMSPSVYSRATDDEKPLFGATVANLLADWGSPKKEAEKKGSESGEWRKWISKEVQDLNVSEELDEDLTLQGIDKDGDETLMMRNEVLEGTMLGPPTPEMMKEDQTAHKREGAEADDESEELTPVAIEQSLFRDKGKAPLVSSPGLRRYPLKRNTESKQSRPSRFELAAPRTTSMNDRFPMLDTGRQCSEVERGSPAKKALASAVSSSGNTSTLWEQRPQSAPGVRAIDITLADSALASSSRVPLAPVHPRGQELRNSSLTGSHVQQHKSLVTLSGQSISSYYTARGSPMGSTSVKTAITVKDDSQGLANINMNNINSNKHKMNIMQNLNTAMLSTPTTMKISATHKPSASSSSTLRSAKWQNHQRLSDGSSPQHPSPSLATLESDLQLIDILKTPHREALALGFASVDDSGKENVSPSCIGKSTKSWNGIGSGKTIQRNSPGKRMAEQWLNERRSETLLRVEVNDNTGNRAGSALG